MDKISERWEKAGMAGSTKVGIRVRDTRYGAGIAASRAMRVEGTCDPKDVPPVLQGAVKLGDNAEYCRVEDQEVVD